MIDRRRFLTAWSALGISSALFPGALWALAAGKSAITKDMIDQAAAIADIAIPDDAQAMMLDSLNERIKDYEAIEQLHIPNSVPSALIFDPVLPGMKYEKDRRQMKISAAPAIAVSAPASVEELAFWTAREQAELIGAKKVTSMALTTMYLDRLKRYDPKLHFVVTLTAERAMAKARQADLEIGAGRYRGPLHGLPWGAKDLLAVKGHRTTWGAGGFETQKFDEDATVVQRLDAAGAVLVAKLTLGALAEGDKWFGGRTRNPWNPQQGSSGSSAGTASATAAGCISFGIGSETLGSISSPSTRCGCTGLRPSFGLVPRTGAMALAWSLDKLGPICRSVEDAAIVLDTIYGPDGHDRSVRDAAFNWDADIDWKSLRVGYLRSEFERSLEPQKVEEARGELTPEQERKREEHQRDRAASRVRSEYDRRYDRAALAKLRAMGVNLTPVEFPKFPYDSLIFALTVEAAAAFDDLTRSGRDKLLTEQGLEDWPNQFRVARLVPAVEYVQAQRARFLAMEAVAKAWEGYDVIVAPTDSDQLVTTNHTGHPAVIVPHGFRGEDAPVSPALDTGDEDNIGGAGTPVSITFLGQIYGEVKVLALARAFQDATEFHSKHPKL
jgi:Asp-tRNA(Asn)/Glu-tRNA(Gln) amidotransferase A subunit family amidase